MENAIEIHNLTKSFGKNVAVNDLSLNIPMGSIFALLGPNGAGKTTTIKTIMNILIPNRGTATVLGVDSKKLGPQEFAQIGYVSENQDLPLWMTVKQFLNYCKSMYANWDDQFCQNLLKQFDLPVNQKLRDLSRGMKMKAVLVSSLSYRPKLLIFDEPFSGLDPLVRQEFIDGILEVAQNREWTSLISSHDIDDVERLADWVGILDHGQLRIAETTETLSRRFKQVEVTLAAISVIDPILPAEWLFYQQEARVVRFVDSAYEQKVLVNKLRELFGEHANPVISGMSLKEIFLTLAKQFKITDH